MKSRQRGNTVIGLIIGLVFGLGIALGIAVYVTKVPIPFMAKTQHRGGAEQDEAEARKNRDWDPNAALAGRPRAPATPPPANANVPQAGTTAPVPVVVAPDANAHRPTRPGPTPAEVGSSSADPLGDLARARAGNASTGTAAVAAATPGADPFLYFVQAGAFRTQDDAEAQRAKLTLMGVEAKVTEREQAGRTVYRVRAGPYNKKDDADRLKERLDSGGLDTALVRVQR